MTFGSVRSSSLCQRTTRVYSVAVSINEIIRKACTHYTHCRDILNEYKPCHTNNNMYTCKYACNTTYILGMAYQPRPSRYTPHIPYTRTLHKVPIRTFHNTGHRLDEYKNHTNVHSQQRCRKYRTSHVLYISLKKK